jgi:hypothetical protein
MLKPIQESIKVNITHKTIIRMILKIIIIDFFVKIICLI